MPLNPDDIRARAEGVGYKFVDKPGDAFVLLSGFVPQQGKGTWKLYGDTKVNGKPYERDLQAALDLIEAEERRQRQAAQNKEMHDVAMPQEKFEQMGRDGKLEEGRGYLVRQRDGLSVARVTVINNDVPGG